MGSEIYGKSPTDISKNKVWNPSTLAWEAMTQPLKGEERWH